MKCKKCGVELLPTQKFCYNCGTANENRQCSICGDIMENGYCIHCRRKQKSNYNCPQRYCIKCSKPVDGEAFLCEQCEANKRRLWMRFVAAVLVVALLSGIAVHFVGNRMPKVKNTEQASSLLKGLGEDEFYETNSKCIEFETHNIVLNGDSEGSVTLTVQLPDYAQLYINAYTSNNPDQFLLEALQSGDYDICEYEIVANVTIENGKQMIHSDEAINMLLEKELAKAINALVEAQK